MKLMVSGPLSNQDLSVINYIRENGPVTACDPETVDWYSTKWKKRIHYSPNGKVRCEALEKKLYSLFERFQLVRIKRHTRAGGREIWHYGIAGKDPGEYYKGLCNN